MTAVDHSRQVPQNLSHLKKKKKRFSIKEI